MTAPTRPRLGTIADLEALLTRYDAKRVFLVTGKRSFTMCGAQAKLAVSLKDCDVVCFNEFTPNPQARDVAEGVRRFRSAQCDLVVAVGGGSVIDVAKLINLCGSNPGETEAFITGEAAFQRRGKPVVAIPTTAGSGAEATHFAAVYIGEKKYSAAHPRMQPDHVILDPELTMTLPPAITAATGIDALAQAIESCWSVGSTADSRRDSLAAAPLVMSNLAGAVAAPSVDNRWAMLEAAHIAGQAINVAKTTAPHAISYTLTSRFGIAHGHAVGLTLSSILVFNAHVDNTDSNDPRGVGFVRSRLDEINRALGVSSVVAAKDALDALMDRVGLERRLRDLSVTRSDLVSIAKSVNAQRLANNPRVMSPEVIGRILESIY